MMKTFISLCTTLFALSLSASAQRFEWAEMGTGGGTNRAIAIALDSAENVYTTGNFSTGVGSENVFSGAHPTPHGGDDIYIVSHDKAGKFRWIRSVGSTDADNVYDICTDRAGYIYIAGYIRGGRYTVDTTVFQGEEAILGFLAKFDTLGNLVWVRRDSAIAYSIFTGIACGPEGDIYVAGRYPQMVFAARYTSDGRELWRNTTTGIGTATSSAIAVDNAGNAFMCGTLSLTILFDSISVKNGTSNYRDIFVASYSPDGRAQWVRTERHGSNDFPNGIGTDRSGNIYICGKDYGSGFLSMYDSSGVQVWTRGLSGTAQAMAVDPPGNVYLTGGYLGTPQFDSTKLPEPPGTERGPAPDLYLAKLDTTRHFAWARAVRGNKGDGGTGIVCDRSGYLYLTGEFGDDWSLYDSMYFDDTILRGYADKNVFTAKMNPFIAIAGVNQSATAHGIALHSPFPNPVSGSTLISFELPRSLPVRLSLFNDRGEEMQLLLDETREGGLHMLRVDAATLVSGLYQLRLVAGTVILTQEMMVVR
jgi:hypothetical protein